MKIQDFRTAGLIWAACLVGLALQPVQAAEMRAWGPEQATGAPNTQGPGDIQTAWASLTEDGMEEWLLLQYSQSVVPQKLRVFETYNPGAVVKITAVNDAGRETVLWQGTDPLRNQASGVAEFALNGNSNTRQIKLYLDSPAVPGWNEIDAVELIGKDGSRQWAKRASASSTYAETTGAVTVDGNRELGAHQNQAVIVHLDNDKTLSGTLLSTGPEFLVLREAGKQRRLFIAKNRVLWIETP
ncbi:hypothetical protein [Parachitinimonas caeni]|uniref:Pappalysin-1 SD scarf domain-containing protein n=1 Tax=Parachitinimonas caeni TaxID=3031301 RepID=A0ABT7E3I9_9NEIS|nr:hypothetical protein [Parachitinimonas caeni]MDK2126809.1 hypothetical protein [Parachitinimonas caeni]